MKIACCTSFAPEHWDELANHMVRSFLHYWPEDVKLYIYYENERPKDFDSPRIEWRNLYDDEDCNTFLEKYGHMRRGPDLVNDLGKYCRKVFAITKEVPKVDWWIWLDADTETRQPITDRFYSKILPETANLVFLGRPWLYASETGFVAYRVSEPGIRLFLKNMRHLWISGDVANMPYWSDAYAFDELRRQSKIPGEHDLSSHLGDDRGIDIRNRLKARLGYTFFHVFPFIPLGEYIRHWKGPVRKKKVLSNRARVARKKD